jgi:hypothetical protein
MFDEYCEYAGIILTDDVKKSIKTKIEAYSAKRFFDKDNLFVIVNKEDNCALERFLVFALENFAHENFVPENFS